jgi:NitT/TauT family transport system ATP-binding protein
MVFQEPRLLPWRTVEQNVRLAAPAATDASLEALFRTLGLTAHRDHYPGELSLGLARRVALARAFAVEPDLLLLDEPFVSLDDALAERLREELAELVNRRPVTTLLVTHDVDEAIGLADRLLLLSASPARVIGEVLVTRPRTARSPEEFAAVREEIARKVKAAPSSA